MSQDQHPVQQTLFALPAELKETQQAIKKAQPRKPYFSGTTSPKSENPNRRFITVLVVMPHVGRYGQRKVMSLTYGCTFDVKVGDAVLCPPTRLNPQWTRGSVKSLDSNGYAGPIKYVASLKKKS